MLDLITSQYIQDVLFYWILPCALMLGLFLLFRAKVTQIYERLDIDRIWRGFVRVGIAVGIGTAIILFIVNSQIFKELLESVKNIIGWISTTDQANDIVNTALPWWQKLVQFFVYWFPYYFRAFVLVWVSCLLIALQSLIWRINFTRGANIIVSTILLSPILIIKYLFGYQTPFFDFIQSRLYIAKLKENLNDSYFDALQGIDERGTHFKDGAGGTVQTQRIKSATIAIRQTRAVVRTSGGTRHAELITRHSRETDTDKIIETALKGLGQRLTAPSIRFQDDPTLNTDRGGYVFDSDVSYRAGDALGSWISIFSNPFSDDNKIKNGGKGVLDAYAGILKDFIRYIRHLTPPAIYDRIKAREERLYTPDLSADQSKYVVQHNLDLAVVPSPLDPETGNDIPTQLDIARKVAKDRVEDVTNALNAFKLRGTFDRVLVGGNTAVYQYTLPRSANLPNDFSKVQEGIANMLKTSDVPIVSVVAGRLSLTMVNGVNIPVDFREMILNRDKGMNTIISGIAGVDALGNNIMVELGDKVPHAMLFGKTGTGKTVTLMDILYSVMDAVDPSMLRIAYVDGKGNSFEFMRSDNSDSSFYHPNPFTYAQPADASGDIDYARALIKHFERETRRRIDLVKNKGVSKLAEFNRRYPKEALPELLCIVDEFSAITDQDKLLKASELATKGTVDTFEYLAKMGRSVGVHLLLANQTARKEKVPGKITANISGRVSLGVTEPIESDIALPDSKIPVHLIDQAGEFYSTMNGIRNVEHGNSPFLPDEVMYALNDSLEKKFGHHDYVISREQVLAEMEDSSELGDEINVRYPIPSPLPSVSTSIDNLIQIIEEYPQWADANRGSKIFVDNDAFHEKVTPKQRNEMKKKISSALLEASKQSDLLLKVESKHSRPSTGEKIAGITVGNDKGTL